MLIKEKISIEEFDDKRYQIRLVEPLEEEKAVLTQAPYIRGFLLSINKLYSDANIRLFYYLDKLYIKNLMSDIISYKAYFLMDNSCFL